jgi:peptide/nickel transport system substrate-binding protein
VPAHDTSVVQVLSDVETEVIRGNKEESVDERLEFRDEQDVPGRVPSGRGTEEQRAERLIALATTLRYDRRQILKRAAAFGLSAPAIAAVLAACGDDDDDDDDEEPTATQAAGQATEAEEEPTEAEEEPTEAEMEETEAEEEPTEEEEEPTEEEAEATPTEGGGGAMGGGFINVSSTAGDSGILNPILVGSLDWVEYMVFSRLMYFDDEGSIQPDLAESWEFSEDNLELTLNLATANWHDGEPFTADDVIFTFDTIAAEDTDTNQASRLQVAGEFITWEKVDDSTVLLTMPEPFAPLLFGLSVIEIIPMHILDGQDVNTSDFNLNPVGTGPFVFSEIERDQFIRLTRNEDWFRGEVLAEGYTIFFTEDTNANIIALEAGELDMIFTPPEAQERFQDNENFTLHNYVYFTSITLAFNHNHEVLADPAFRKAVELGIDKASWTESVTRGRGIVSHNQFAETGPLDRYNDYDNIVPVEFDQEGAAAALEELGWVAGGDGIREQNGVRLSFNVITYSGFDEYQNGMVIFQDQMAQIGIEITPNVVEFSTLEEMWADPEDDPNNRAFELEEWPHPNEFDPDLYNELHSDNFPPNLNYMWYANDEIDALLIEGRTTTDPDARVDVYRQIDTIRAEDLPCIPLYLAVDGWVAANTVLGADGEPIQSDYFRQFRFVETHTFWKEA